MKKIWETFLMATMCVVGSYSFGQSNRDLSGGVVWESEPYMVINPANPQHIVVAWMGNVLLSHLCIKTIATFDGGVTWSSPAVIAHVSPTYTSADVSMAFDHSGNLFITYIDSRQSPDSGAVYIVKSADGGLSWSVPNMAISGFADGTKYPLDRPWLTISRTTGATPDTLYVTTKPAPWVAPPNRPYFVKSHDAGVIWTAWRNIDSTGYLVGNVIQAPMAAPAVDSAGKFHCIYPSYLPSQSVYPRYLMATNGQANSFSYDTVHSMIGVSSIDTLAKAGGRFVCDPSNNNHFAFVHLENKYGDIDIFSIESFNRGVSWGPLLRVNDDAQGNGKMQDLAWANFDEHGNLVTAWRDRRNAPGSGYQQPSEVWGSVKWKDSLGFSANFKLSDTLAPYDSIYLSGAGNDFMNVAMAQDTLSAVWGDVRTGALNIWFSRKAFGTDTTVPTIVKRIAMEQIPVVNIYPNPTHGIITFEGVGMVNIAIRDLKGNTLLRKDVQADRLLLNVSGISAGVYEAEIATVNGIVNEKLVIE